MQEKMGVVIALEAEADALLGRTTWRFQNAQKECVLQLQDGLQLIVILAGIGMANAEKAASDLISRGVKAMVNVGLAGGLDPELKAGHIIVAGEILQIDQEDLQGSWIAYAAGAELAHAVLRSNGIVTRSGTILTAQQAILTCEQKESLYNQTRALAVDMESAAVASVAGRADIPFFGLRAICDPADKTVPRDLFSCLNQNGRIQISSVLRNLARRPALFSDMLHMGHTFSIARKALRHAWQLLIKNGLPQALIPTR